MEIVVAVDITRLQSEIWRVILFHALLGSLENIKEVVCAWQDNWNDLVVENVQC